MGAVNQRQLPGRERERFKYIKRQRARLIEVLEMYVLRSTPRAFHRSSTTLRFKQEEATTIGKKEYDCTSQAWGLLSAKAPRQHLCGPSSEQKTNAMCTLLYSVNKMRAARSRITAREQQRWLSASMSTSPCPSGSLAPLQHPKRANRRGKRWKRFNDN